MPAELKARILARAEGNPFYLEEILRSLIDQGALVQEQSPGRWQVMMEVERIAIPDTLEGVLVARIDRLHEETRRVLQLALVIGRIFLYRILAEIAAAEAAAYEELALDRRLEKLQREELIRERARLPEVEYIFKHDLTREAAYNGLLKRDRRVYHRQVAEALERLFPQRIEEMLGLLAHHWERAGEAETATGYLLQAGDQARLAYAHEEALDYYQRALRFLKRGAHYERAARTMMKVGLTHHNAFDYVRARQAHEEGFALWQRAGEMAPVLALPPAPHALPVHLSDPPTLDPSLSIDYVSGVVIDHLFSGLLSLTPELSVEPDVARRWEVAGGGRKYVFHLRDDVVWSDGLPVTARDFEYAWKRALDPATRSPAASLLYDIVGARSYHQGQGRVEKVAVRAVDDATLTVELEGPVGYFLPLLACAATCPVPRHVVQARGAAWAEGGGLVSNGPFRLASWRREASMVLARNPAYHGRFGGNVDRVELALLTEDEWQAQLGGYEDGSLDALEMFGFAGSEVARVRQRHPGEYVTGPLLSTAYVGFDTSRPPFDDVRVRRAFVLATDREWLADVVMGAESAPATGGLVPPGMPGHAAGIGLPFDPEEARALLAEAGYPGGRRFPAVSAMTPTGSEAFGGYPAAFWREHLGLEVHFETLDWAAYLARQEEEPSHLFALGWVANYPDPDSFLRVCSFRRYTRWRQPIYDRLVERARRSTDQAQRMALYARAEQILVEEAPILPLIYNRRHLLVKPWLSRYPTSAMRSPFWKDVVIEPH